MPFQQALAEPALLAGARDLEASPRTGCPGAPAGREPRAGRRAAAAASVANAARARTGAQPRPAPRAQSRPDGVQPGRAARGIFLIESRPHPGVLHGARRDARSRSPTGIPATSSAGPEIFGGRAHLWSGVAASNSTRRANPGQGVARAGDANSDPRDRHHRRPHVQGQVLFGAGADARHALDHRAPGASAAASGRYLRRQGAARHLDRRRFHPCRSRPHGRRHAAMGHHQPQALAGAGCGRLPQVAGSSCGGPRCCRRCAARANSLALPTKSAISADACRKTAHGAFLGN